MPLANYTTKVPVSRSLQLIQELLVRAGAQSILTDFEQGEAAAISFRIQRGERSLGIRLPGNWRGVLQVMTKDPKVPRSLKRTDQAKRVAWRTVHDWLRAQLAMVEVGNASMEQVMLSYVVAPSGETLYERLEREEFYQLALPAACS